MSDKEEKTQKELMKESLLNELADVSTQRSSSFSPTKYRRTKKTNNDKPRFSFSNSSNDDESILKSLGSNIRNQNLSSLGVMDDDGWNQMMDIFDEISPIDDITYEDRLSYRRKKSGDKYDDMFSKEQSMLNDLLSGLQKKSKAIDKKLESMTGKGTYGVGKNYADLVSASNSLETTKLSIIKELVGIKKTAVDLRMKDDKLNGTNDVVEDNDTVADRFYKSILKGNSKEFIESSMSEYNSSSGIQNYNISQPFAGGYDAPEDYDDNSADKYGYIANEIRNVEICLCQYDDGSMEFVAMDEDGNVVDNYELPSPDLIDNISIKPGAAYAYDEYARKYKIVSPEELMVGGNDINTDAYVSGFDIDDPSIDDVDDDDKYEYDDEE